MRVIVNRIILFVAFLNLISCNQKNIDKENAIALWLGKEIVIPEGSIYQIGDTAVEYCFDAADFKIVTYIDSTGCTACRMKLNEWDKFINELKGIDDVEINFVLIIDSKDKYKITDILKTNSFDHPVIIDTEFGFSKLNEISENVKLHTFLLDDDNKVVIVGNPINNPKIKELYYKLLKQKKDNIFSNSDSRILNENDCYCGNPVISLGIVHVGDTINKIFRITNNGNDTFALQEMIPSCNCLKLNISSSIIPTGEYADVEMTYVVDSIKGYFSRSADIYFNERKNPVHLVMHGFNK
ncbi:DUF1573 domain-containing protein [Muribaculaceae bacterium Isolate-113 (HZI)]|nr:DUF1573 domain-containing protein [Muribaculaceae bacterium Isolate-114 (HZI)]ROT20416.1 DUF1573 domain-containing protein [Muribaculaceae bacterium Isolate-113 (HZI)]